MTPVYLRKALKEELERIFEGFRSGPEAGYSGKPVSVFEQALPLNEAARERDFAPFIIVRLTEGRQEDWEGAESVTVFLIFCSVDEGLERHGQDDVLNMIQKVKERLMQNPQIDSFFTAELPIKWAVQDDDTYPIYYGGMELIFDCPAICRESRFA